VAESNKLCSKVPLSGISTNTLMQLCPGEVLSFHRRPTAQEQLKAKSRYSNIFIISSLDYNQGRRISGVCLTLTMVSWADARAAPASHGKTPSSRRKTMGKASETVVPVAATTLCAAGAGRDGWPSPGSRAHAVGSERERVIEKPRRRLGTKRAEALDAKPPAGRREYLRR
jgi:hypothetical protein